MIDIEKAALGPLEEDGFLLAVQFVQEFGGVTSHGCELLAEFEMLGQQLIEWGEVDLGA